MNRRDDGLHAAMVRRGMSRRSFLKFSAAMAAALALPASYAPRIARAVEGAPRLPVVWLRGQACGGNTEAFVRAAQPSIAELLLDLLSVDYLESLMASTGAAADAGRLATMERYPEGYVAVVEGAVPTADGGAYCTVGGRAFGEIVREVTDGALATIAVGSCAFDGGLSAAAGGSTGAVGAERVMSGGRLITLPGCPVNVENLVATIVHYLTFGEFPATDSRRRPLFAYGGLIHNQCERRAHFEFGEFVLAWGDEASQKGWCLYKMGCKGPETFANCPTARYAEGTSWPIKAGVGCIGCHSPGFWDAMSPFYGRLPSFVPFAPDVTADQIGTALVGGIAAASAAHGAASYVIHRRRVRADRRAAVAAAAAGPAVVVEEPTTAALGAEARVAESPADVVVEPPADVAVEPPADVVVEPSADGTIEPPPEPPLEPAVEAAPTAEHEEDAP
jgi:hydrogenase small subunit